MNFVCGKKGTVALIDEMFPDEPPVRHAPRRKRAPMPERESTVIRECQKWLTARGLLHWRNNTGAVAFDGGGFIRYGQVGSPDIIGCTPTGYFFGVECKSKKGKPSALQVAWRMRCEMSNGIYILAHDLTEMIAGWRLAAKIKFLGFSI